MDYLLVTREDNIITLTLNRPECGNAANDEMLEQLLAAIKEAGKDGAARALILTGAGDSFCVSADFGTGAARFKWHELPPPLYHRNYRNIIKGIVCGLQELPIPTIAMVNGPAGGLGSNLALACDMRVGSEKASFCEIWTKNGLIPGGGGAWLLERLVGLGRAAELIFSGRLLEAVEAERIGVLNRLVPSAQLKKETMALAGSMAALPPLGIQFAKLNLYKGYEVDLATAIELSGACQTVLVSSEDHKEAIAALRQKRPGSFKGR